MMPYSPDKYYYSLKKIEDRYAKAVRGAHANALRQVYSYLDKQKEALSPTDLGYILSVFSSVRTNLRPLIGTYTYASFSLGNQRVANLFHFGEAIPYQKGAYRSIMERNYKWVEKYGADREDALKQTLAESLESDYSMPKLKQQIKQQMNVTSFRAETIARSETQKTFSQSSRLAIANSGVTREYQWETSHLESVCPICRPLDGRTYSIDDKNSPMPVSHTHPNCLISHFEKVFTSKGWEQIGKIKIGDLVLTKEGKFRKVLQTFKDTDYREVVEITIQDSTLKITGEHPIMTDKGYVPANQIAINDKIMVKTKKCKECEELLFDHPYSVSDFCNGECRHRYIGKVTWKNHRKAIMAGINSENNIQTKRKMFLENNPAQSDEARKKISEYKTKHNPMHHKEYRDVMAATQIKRLSDPEVREKMSESAIKFHKDNPGHMKGKLQKAREGDPERYRQQRKKQGESLKKFYQKHPEKHPNRIMGRQGRVSAPQKELFQTIKNIYSEAKLEFPIKTKESCRFGDIVLPNKKICIEHDGKYWHQDTAEQDLKRDRELAQVGYTTIRVNEDDSHTALSQILAVLANHNSEYEFMFIPAQNVKKYTPKRRLSLYNIEVEEFNNYIAKGLVTHNCNCRIRPYWDDTDVDLEEEKQFIKDFWEAEEK